MLRRSLWPILILLALVAGAALAFSMHHRASAGSSSAEHENERIVFLNGTACGVERWSIKTGIDRGAHLVNMKTTVRTSIFHLRSLVPPRILPLQKRISPTEITVFRLTATLLRYKIESDSDIHLVLVDTGGRTMIAEIPAPPCVGATSPFALQIRTVRDSFINRFHPTDNWIRHKARLTLTGVGFFDIPHGQNGVAPNAIELHPILHIAYHQGSPPPVIVTTPVPATPGPNLVVTASVSDPTPQKQTMETVNGRITVSGVGVPGAPMDTVWHYKSKDVTCSGTTDASGAASCSRDIGIPSRGFTVKIDVTFTYEGYAYTVTTSFTPA